MGRFEDPLMLALAGAVGILLRTDSIGRDAPSEDEFPSSGCMFIEPITLGSETDVR